MAYVGSGGVNVYYDAWSVAVEEENPVAQETSFGKAHPNPFSARTLIELTLPKTSAVSVKAYNVLGQEVSTIFNGTKDAGTHSIEWKGTDNNGNRLPSGIYFMRIKTPYRTSSKKLILQ
jgi:flagellar hook assembly protein FlgD